MRTVSSSKSSSTLLMKRWIACSAVQVQRVRHCRHLHGGRRVALQVAFPTLRKPRRARRMRVDRPRTALLPALARSWIARPCMRPVAEPKPALPSAPSLPGNRTIPAGAPPPRLRITSSAFDSYGFPYRLNACTASNRRHIASRHYLGRSCRRQSGHLKVPGCWVCVGDADPLTGTGSTDCTGPSGSVPQRRSWRTLVCTFGLLLGALSLGAPARWRLRRGCVRCAWRCRATRRRARGACGRRRSPPHRTVRC